MAFFAICNPRHCEQIFNLRGNLFLRTINKFPLHFQEEPFLNSPRPPTPYFYLAYNTKMCYTYDELNREQHREPSPLC